ncbi:NfeD family protein [Bacillus alkalicellulosilyticus]|uniref:NfeD family protein n=1 Tax=Alkalihalobacterium alkalicellulosilyticum TaxID=1912214 RepID=UPI000998A378|nr:NfeD family protein [Bacillus alkalicellulosilyticus]
MEMLNIASVGFLVVFLGTLFLVGELLVRVKGLFAIIGIGIMSVYFTFHISGEVGLWVVLLYLVGLVLLIVDGKVVNDGTIALLGAILMILALAIPSPSIIYGVLVSMGFIIGAFTSLLFLKVFPARDMWAKMTLKDKMTNELGYNSLNESYKGLVGKTGKTISPFRPTGTVVIEGQQYSATSGSQWLGENEEVEVVSVDGTRIVVRRIEQEEEKKD